MRKKQKCLLLVFVFFTLLNLLGCTNPTNIQKVTIVKDNIIENTISKSIHDEMKKILKKVEWNPGTRVSMVREEDITMNISYENTVNRWETNYLIWFSGRKAELISSDDNESFGRLTEKETTLLKNIVGFHPSQSLSEYIPSDEDIVSMHGKVTNANRFNLFLKHVQKAEFDEIRIVHYTVEGDPILHDLIYNGNEIHSTLDTRRDKFGEGEIGSTICKSIVESKSEYVLKDCKNPVHTYLLPKNIAK